MKKKGITNMKISGENIGKNWQELSKVGKNWQKLARVTKSCQKALKTLKTLKSTDEGWVTFGRRTTRCVYGVQVKTGKMKTGGGTLGEIGKTLYIVHCQKLLTFAVYNITGRDPLQSVCV